MRDISLKSLNKEIREKVSELDSILTSMRDEALMHFEEILGAPSTIHKMHAHIGRNNNTFVDSVRMQFQSPEDFIARWIHGLAKKIENDKHWILERKERGYAKTTVEILPSMLDHDFLKKYIHLFLERNFYRNFKERVRSKPDECLWQLWFGPADLFWGLFISPALREGDWTNDKSQMRREGYHYWTVGHALQTGLVVPDTTQPHQFTSSKEFIQFYSHVLTRVSNSQYEKDISRRYVNYLEVQNDIESTPLLIPELRFEGKEKKHLYRLDFCILNPFTMKMVGFEISPSSSHMSISGIRSKTQKGLNEELAAKWAKEADKRNQYFSKFGISTVTFSDKELENLDACFDVIKTTLEERSDIELSISGAEEALSNALKSLK
tara:strand:- start:183 stop:1322 length:1140 start_codon:yes stop_codon:yes gene_type:complete